MSIARRIFGPAAVAVAVGLSLLSSGCEQPATAASKADSLAKASIRTLDGLIGSFRALPLPTAIPSASIDVANQEVIDQGYLDLAVIGTGRLFETKPDGALIFYSKLTYTGRFIPLVIAVQQADGIHYHLCTLSTEGKAIDRKEIAFNIVAKNLEGARTANIGADLRITMNERTRNFSVLTPEQMKALGATSVVRESISTRTEVFQVSADGKINEAAWQRPDEPAK